MFDYDGRFMCNDTCRIITGSNLQSLLHLMNSKLFFYAVKTFYGGGGLGEGIRMKHTFFLQFSCIQELMFRQEADDSIDEQIFTLYQLTPEEIDIIEK